MVEPVPVAAPGDAPKAVLDRAGSWLASQFPEGRWLKSRNEVVRNAGTTQMRLHLQPSKWNATGVGTWVHTRLMIMDKKHTAWLRADRPTSPGLLICAYNTLLTNTVPGIGRVEVSGLRQSKGLLQANCSLAGFRDGLRTEVEPIWRLFSQSPTSVAVDLPTTWLGMVDAGTVEWALAHGDRDAALLLVKRHMARPITGAQTWESRLQQFTTGWLQEHEPAFHMSTHTLGWTCKRFGLVSPEDLDAPHSVNLVQTLRSWRRKGRSVND